MTNPADWIGGAADFDDDISKVPQTADIIVSRHARSIRLRKFARRHLDELLGQIDPWDHHAEPVDYHAAGLDLGVRERQFRGEELAAAGWTP